MNVPSEQTDELTKILSDFLDAVDRLNEEGEGTYEGCIAEARAAIVRMQAEKKWGDPSYNPNIDLNNVKNMLQFIDDPIEKFNMFLLKWCPAYSHLIDSDDNDGQEIRHMIAELKAAAADGEKS
jgi:hypothetical protein